MKTTFFRLFVVFGFFAFGYGVIQRSTSKFTVARDPAAVRQVYDFSHLRGEALDDAIKQRVVAGIEVFKKQDQISVGLGHFAFVNEAGEKTLGCREYGKVVMIFEAEGVVVNGERPRMEVQGACDFSEDLALINPLTIPVAKILGEKPADGEFQFRDGKEITVKFRNLSDEWPRKWLLTGVKVTGDKGEIAVDYNDLNKQLGHSVLLTF